MVLGALGASQPSQFDECQANSRPCLKRDEKDTQGCPLVSKQAHMYVHTYIKNSLVYSDMQSFVAKRKPTLSWGLFPASVPGKGTDTPFATA